jgi:hypothetical protein
MRLRLQIEPFYDLSRFAFLKDAVLYIAQTGGCCRYFIVLVLVLVNVHVLVNDHVHEHDKGLAT